jgi:hypothetical protein
MIAYLGIIFIAFSLQNIFCMDTFEGCNKQIFSESNKYGVIELLLTQIRNEDSTNKSWENSFAALHHYEQNKSKFTIDLLKDTIKQIAAVTHESKNKIILQFRANCYKAPRSSEKSFSNICAQRSAFNDTQSCVLNNNASAYKMLQLSIKVWRHTTTWAEENWREIYYKSKVLRSDDEVDAAHLCDAVQTFYDESIKSDSTIWGDASILATPDSEAIDHKVITPFSNNFRN